MFPGVSITYETETNESLFEKLFKAGALVPACRMATSQKVGQTSGSWVFTQQIQQTMKPETEIMKLLNPLKIWDIKFKL